MDAISVVSSAVPNTPAGVGAMPSGLAILIWAPLVLLVAVGIGWLALSAWLDRRREQRAARAVPRTLDIPLEFLRPDPASATKMVETAPRRLPAAWLDLDLDFGPPPVAGGRRVRPL
ncbi:MAG TPA: hypothetical protein VHE37_16410 [Nevskiaceae bacterium]|nr:hypothetical protein [Nevskiaceae bacterium]